MSYIQFRRNQQRRFLKVVLQHTTLRDVAREYGFSERTIRDWRREKFHANYEIIHSLSVKYKVPLPDHKILKTGWHLAEAGKVGGQNRLTHYGPPGTPEGRKKGGRVSQQRRRENPEYYRKLGCKVRKPVKKLTPSIELAELFGILMGDGGITDYQIKVSLDKNADRGYDEYVAKLIYRISGERPSRKERENVVNLSLSSISFVEELERLGLRRGNKVVHQIVIPSWIHRDSTYQRACLRGLFDTDGGIYIHKKAKAAYIGWCFDNHSKPIIRGVSRILSAHGFKHSVQAGRDVRMYRLSDILRYMSLIGSNNPKNGRRIRANIQRRSVPNG